MKHQRAVIPAIVFLATVGMGTVATAQTPAPPAATKPNQDTAAANLLAECVKKEQARTDGTTRASATETCKKRLTSEPVIPTVPGESSNPETK